MSEKYDINFTFRMNSKVKKELDKLCKEKSVNSSALLRKCIDDFIKENKGDE